MGMMRRLASYVLAAFVATSPAPAALPEPAPALTQAPRKKKRRTSRLTTSKTRWYLADLEKAIRLADGGDMSEAARLYRALRRDGVVLGLLSTRTGGLVRMRRKFNGDPEVRAALEGGTGKRTLFDELFPPSELALLAADGIVCGIGIAEMVEVVDVFGRVRAHREMRRLDPEFLRYRWVEDRWYYSSSEGEIPITPGVPDACGRIFLLHRPGGKQEPWTHGQWAALGRAYIAKEHAFHHRENYSSKLANPARVAVSPAGATEAQRRGFFEKVMAWGINTVFGLVPGWDVKLLESNGRGYEVFAETIKTSNEEYMVALVGQLVTVTGGSGFSSNDLYATVRSDLIEETGDGLAHTLNEQGIPSWSNLAFGADRTATVLYDTTPPKNLKAEAESLGAAGAAIDALSKALAPHGMKPDVAAIASKLGTPIANDVTGDGEPDVSPRAPVVGPDPDAPTDTMAAEFANQLTQLGVERCAHGRSNRCPMCGVERVRKVEIGPDGQPHWPIAWRPIGGAPAAPAAPLEQAS